jgi:Uma2 family endonuclease
MAYTKHRFASFEEYLAAESSDLPEGRYEYWDGALVEVMTESLFNDGLANYLYFLLMQAGIFHELLRPHSCEVEVIGRPKTRFPDLTILDDAHLTLMGKNNRVTRRMPPPRVLVEVISPGNESSENYIRDYQDKPAQYAAIGVPEIWQIDPDRNYVRIGTLIDGNYQFQTFSGNQPDGQTIVSPTFPELKLTAKQILLAGR